MSSQTRSKLNWLAHQLPEGRLVDAAWLEKHGISRQLRRKYVMSGWLVTPVRGVYQRPTPRDANKVVAWQELLSSLNDDLGFVSWSGGRTALELRGFAHYLQPNGPREVHLYTTEHLPGWVNRLPVDTKLVLHNASRLFMNNRDLDVTSESPFHSSSKGRSLTSSLARAPVGVVQGYTVSRWSSPLAVADPERAILELLDEVPKRESFHQVDVIVEGLSNLSPQKLNVLLKDCRSVKVKRLFFWFAERHNHAWVRRLDRSNIDLGTGKRALFRGGRLDPKYNITLPRDLDAAL
jgi:hypothetical protein